MANNKSGFISSLSSIAKILGVSSDTFKFITEQKPYGIVKKRELLLFDNEKYWLVWDYIIWNELTLENVKSGQKASMWQGMSDEEAQNQFDEIFSKLNGK